MAVARTFDAVIWLISGSRRSRATSLLGMLGLGARQGTPLTIMAQGVDAQRAVMRLSAFFNSQIPPPCGEVPWE
jgi:phosphotransferase system HPr (HPr) family protein